MQCCLLLLMRVTFETNAPLGNCLKCEEGKYYPKQHVVHYKPHTV